MDNERWHQFEQEVVFPKYEEIFTELGERNKAQVSDEVYIYDNKELVRLIVCLLNKMGSDEDRAKIIKKVIMYYRGRAIKNEREKER